MFADLREDFPFLIQRRIEIDPTVQRRLQKLDRDARAAKDLASTVKPDALIVWPVEQIGTFTFEGIEGVKWKGEIFFTLDESDRRRIFLTGPGAARMVSDPELGLRLSPVTGHGYFTEAVVLTIEEAQKLGISC